MVLTRDNITPLQHSLHIMRPAHATFLETLHCVRVTLNGHMINAANAERNVVQ